MKPDIHPSYNPVVFHDPSTGYQFLTRSTMTSEKTTEWEDGNEYPLITLDISSSSHPFYTGQQRMLDTAGRVERFERRYARLQEKRDETKADEAGGEEAAAEAAPDEAPSGEAADAGVAQD